MAGIPAATIKLLKDAMRLNNQRAELDDRVFKRRKCHIHQRLDQLIVDPYDDDDARRLAKRLKNFRGELLTFLDHEGVPPSYRGISLSTT